MSDDVLEATKGIIAEKAGLDIDAIAAETEISGLDITSLDLAEIVFELEDRFDVEIELNAAAAWDKLKTVSDVAAAVSEIVAAKS
ncbi:MAG: acyl carrier protein [Notoacmeibacter sp.]|nr:acyl carrier protein [Notoacmeibacter sp.]